MTPESGAAVRTPFSRRPRWWSAVPWLPMAMLAPLLICGLLGPLLTAGQGQAPDLQAGLLPPVWLEGGSWKHLLGTDQFGRDLVARLAEGAQVSLIVCVAGVLTAALIGITIGVLAGYAGGNVDNLLMRLADMQMSIPAEVS